MRSTSCNVALINIQDQIAQFWTIEQGPKRRVAFVEERADEEHYKIQTYRDPVTGRYVVRSPFRGNASELSESYSTAMKRFHALEWSLSRKPEIRAQYTNFMREYHELGHIFENESPSTFEGYYLSRHAVLKKSRLIMKLRVVFDGSAKTSTGSSLIVNQTLMVGPIIQEDLFIILVRFRSHAFAPTADIAKMHWQIQVGACDRKYQKIPWHDNGNEPIRTYTLKTVTYGTAPASFLWEMRKEDFYVDDLLSKAQTLSEAKQIRDELRGITHKTGFHLRQWALNDDGLTEDITECSNNALISLDLSSTVKTPGVNCNAKRDIISYTVS